MYKNKKSGIIGIIVTIIILILMRKEYCNLKSAICDFKKKTRNKIWC